MYTAEQRSQVIQFIHQYTDQLATESLLQRVYDIDFAEYTHGVSEGLFDCTYEEYMQEVWDDAYGARVTFLDVIEKAIPVNKKLSLVSC
jgi:hypothetical protein